MGVSVVTLLTLLPPLAAAGMVGSLFGRNRLYRTSGGTYEGPTWAWAAYLAGMAVFVLAVLGLFAGVVWAAAR